MNNNCNNIFYKKKNSSVINYPLKIFQINFRTNATGRNKKKEVVHQHLLMHNSYVFSFTSILLILELIWKGNQYLDILTHIKVNLEKIEMKL